MSLFNSLLASAAATMGGVQKEQINVLTALGQTMKQYPGGPKALLERFQEGGLGEVVNSWMKPDTPSLAVNEDQLESVLGASFIGDLISKSGLNQQVILSQLVKLLPIVVGAVFSKGVDGPAQLDTATLMQAVLSQLAKK